VWGRGAAWVGEVVEAQMTDVVILCSSPLQGVQRRACRGWRAVHDYR
jgi:hypothetical protein